MFWYGLDRSILHQSGRVLSGPPAAEAFADLSAEDVRSLLLSTGYQPSEVIEESIAARSGEPSPSGPQSRAFQRRVLEEICAST